MLFTRLSTYVGLIVLAFMSPVARAIDIETARYLNFALGNRWVYQQSASPGLWSVQVDSVTVRNGTSVILLQEYDSNGFKNDQDFFASDLSAGARLVGGLNDFGQPTQETFFYEPAIVRLLGSFEPGQTYFETSQRTDYPGLVFSHAVVFTIESVTVPAGQFTSALHVYESISTQVLGTLAQDLWYVEGLGLVKRVQDDGNIWELQGFFGSVVPEPAQALLFLAGLVLLRFSVMRRESAA